MKSSQQPGVPVFRSTATSPNNLVTQVVTNESFLVATGTTAMRRNQPEKNAALEISQTEAPSNPTALLPTASASLGTKKSYFGNVDSSTNSRNSQGNSLFKEEVLPESDIAPTASPVNITAPSPSALRLIFGGGTDFCNF